MAKIDWARASGGTLTNGDKLLKELVTGKQAAYDALATASVGKPFAAVLVPHLVPLGDKPLALRLLASIADELDVSHERGAKRVTDALKPVVARLPALLVHDVADVRAAAAVLAGALDEKTGLAQALAAETDARAKVAQLTSLGDAKAAKRYLADGDLAVATAAALIANGDVTETLVRAIADASLDAVPWPGRSLRAAAANTLLSLAFPKKLRGAPSKHQIEILRALFAVERGPELVMQRADALGLPNRIETVRRIANIPEPVPADWASAVAIEVGGVRESALAHWLRYEQTATGDPRAIARAIAKALGPADCARVILEVCSVNFANRFEGELALPPLPAGGKLGAKKGWESWTIYKKQNEKVLADAYADQLRADGWTVAYGYDPADPTTTRTARIEATRDGLEVSATFYEEGKADSCVTADVHPTVFPLFVEAALERHGDAFVKAIGALPKRNLAEWGNVGYWVPYAARVVALRQGTPPPASIDPLVIKHQGAANVLLPSHLTYIGLLPPRRQQQVVAGILDAGHRSLAQLYPSDLAFAAAARGLGNVLASYSTYFHPRAASAWVFLGDHAVPVIAKALAAKKVGNPDFAAQILAEIGTPAAKRALAKLAKHPDKKVKQIVKAALARS